MSAKESAGNESIGQSEKTEKAMSALSGIHAERIQIVATEEIDGLAKLSNNLYNETTIACVNNSSKLGIYCHTLSYVKSSKYQ